MHLEYGELDSDYVFVNLWGGQIGRAMTYANVNEIVCRTRARVGFHFTAAHVLPLRGIPRKRHTAAMRLPHAGVDTTVIAPWLGHEQVETTQMYLHAELALKERALARTKPLDSKPGRYRPPDALLAFLDGL